MNQPQRADFHGDDDRLCLFRLSAKVRGRVQGTVNFGYGSHGGYPRPDRTTFEKLPDPWDNYIALFPIQQSFLAFQPADFSQILTDFQGAFIVTFFVSYRKVADVNKPAL